MRGTVGWRLDLTYLHHIGLNLRLFTSNRSKTNRVIFSYSDNTGYDRGVSKYRVGSVNMNGYIDNNSWDRQRVIEKFDASDICVRDFEVNIGNIRSKKSADLLYMQLCYDNASKNSKERKYTLRYKIGFNMNSGGLIRGGWSDTSTIPCDFSRAGRISGCIMDIDGDGTLDLVVVLVELNKGVMMTSGERNYVYFRVGKNFSVKGIVQGGWTDYKMIPSKTGSPTSPISRQSVILGSSSGIAKRGSRNSTKINIQNHFQIDTSLPLVIVGRDLESDHSAIISAHSDREGDI